MVTHIGYQKHRQLVADYFPPDQFPEHVEATMCEEDWI